MSSAERGIVRPAPYTRVAELLARQMPPETYLPLQLKDGNMLFGTVPTGIQLVDSPNGRASLHMQFVQYDKSTGSVALDTIEGIEVVEKDGKHRIRFTYFNPKTGEPEENPREIVYKDTLYGTAPGHAAINEGPDFYINGDDMQYPEGQRDRTFPLWRMGMYGNPERASRTFMPIPGEGDFPVTC